MSSSVDQIKSKIDIVSLVSSYIKLEKAGGNFKGRCPFHNEKTPSFFVSPDRGSYYCFGCFAKGDIFTFVQEFEGLDFIGSLKVLADRAGVVLEQYNSGDKTEKERLHSVLEQAVFFYQKNLDGNPPAPDHTGGRAGKDALKYLHDRGVTDEIIKEFRIGFAPSQWRDLFDYLVSRGVTEGDMLEVGLIKRKDGSTSSPQAGMVSYYDTFRGRIMFPINDLSGRVVGFSGRILIPDEKSPKYLNSPETTLFKKSEVLFGLDKAKKDIRLKDYSVLVEGQMDLIMLHQVGITNTVASSGTALTENHLIKLRRLSNRIIMAYDADSAGFSASNRSSQIALSLGMDLKLASFPDGKDPADLAKDDIEKLKNCFKTAKHIIDFYTDTLLGKNLEPRKLGEEIRKNVLPYISMLPSSIEQSHFIKSIAQKTFIKEEALWDDLVVPVPTLPDALSRSPRDPVPKRTESIERRVWGIILWQKISKNRQEEIDIVQIEKRAREIFGEKILEVENKYEKEKESLLFETEAYYNDKTNLIKDIEELLLGLQEEYLKEEFSIAMNNLQKAEQSKDAKVISQYLEECQIISQRINTIKNVKK